MAAGSGFCAEEKGLWKVLFRGEGGGRFWEDGQQRVKGDTLHSRLRSVFHTGKGWRCCYGFAAEKKMPTPNVFLIIAKFFICKLKPKIHKDALTLGSVTPKRKELISKRGWAPAGAS